MVFTITCSSNLLGMLVERWASNFQTFLSFYECSYICNWQNVLGTHHASAHGGSSDLIVKMLDSIILK